MIVIVGVASLPERGSWRNIQGLLVLVAMLLLAGFLLIAWYYRWQSLKEKLVSMEHDLDQARKRMATIFRLGHQFVRAEDEKQIIQMVLETSLDLSEANGASFVPLDEYHLSLPAVSAGHLPEEELLAWAEHLARPAVRYQCTHCQRYDSDADTTCPLLDDPFPGTAKIRCLPVRRGDQELGMLNLYFSREGKIDPEITVFINAILDEMAMALETARLRQRELKSISDLKRLPQTDQAAFLPALLENLVLALNADFALLQLVKDRCPSLPQRLDQGTLPNEFLPEMESFIREMIAGQASYLIPGGGATVAPPPGVTSLVACPLVLPDREVLGGLLLGSTRPSHFNHWSLENAQIVAAQMALFVEYSNTVRSLEYKTLVEERRRLSREIHDGLAQTLGYLKLVSVQMSSYLDRGDYDRLDQAIQQQRSALNEAYQDAREAIEGLRLTPDTGLEVWLAQTASEFQEKYEIGVQLSITGDVCDLAPEVQAQLARIIQESLNNVRKHASATRVKINVDSTPQALCIEVNDDGQGYEHEDLPGGARFGLQSLYERAELISAHLEIDSGREHGTLVRISLPVQPSVVISPN